MQPPSETSVARWLAEADRPVVFTGAGMSTESGIPDFRSPGGIWSKYRTVYYDEFLDSAAARRHFIETTGRADAAATGRMAIDGGA